jgi:1,2-diacylglycerol 3-alpha-glucosyltransferase
VRVAHFCDSQPGRADGVARSAGLSVALLRAAGHEVDHYFPGPLLGGGMRSVAVPFRRIRVALPWVRADRAADLVHVHTTGPVGMAGFRLAGERGLPLVLTWHTDLLAYAEHFPEIPVGAAYCAARLRLGWGVREHLELAGVGGRRHPRLLALGRAMMARTSLVLAPSGKTAAGLAAFGELPPVWTVPTPVTLPPDATTRDEARAALGMPAGAAVVLSVGRVTPEKNPLLLLRAFAEVRAARPDALLVLLGADQGRRAVRAALRDLGLTGAVRLLPPVPHERVAGYYRMADVLAFASTTDTQSLVLAEAEAAGLPVVSADGDLAHRPAAGNAGPANAAGEADPANAAGEADPANAAGEADPAKAASEAAGEDAGGDGGGDGDASCRVTCAATPAALAAALLRMLADADLRDRTRRAGLAATAAYPPERYLARLTAAYIAAVESHAKRGAGRPARNRGR